MTAETKTIRQSLREIFMPRTVLREKEEEHRRAEEENQKKLAQLRQDAREKADMRMMELARELPDILSSPSVTEAFEEEAEVSLTVGSKENVSWTRKWPGKEPRLAFNFFGARWAEDVTEKPGYAAIHHAARDLNVQIEILDVYVSSGFEMPGLEVLAAVIYPRNTFSASSDAGTVKRKKDPRQKSADFSKPLDSDITGRIIPKLAKIKISDPGGVSG